MPSMNRSGLARWRRSRVARELGRTKAGFWETVEPVTCGYRSKVQDHLGLRRLHGDHEEQARPSGINLGMGTVADSDPRASETFQPNMWSNWHPNSSRLAGQI